MNAFNVSIGAETGSEFEISPVYIASARPAREDT